MPEGSRGWSREVGDLRERRGPAHCLPGGPSCRGTVALERKGNCVSGRVVSHPREYRGPPAAPEETEEVVKTGTVSPRDASGHRTRLLAGLRQ